MDGQKKPDETPVAAEPAAEPKTDKPARHSFMDIRRTKPNDGAASPPAVKQQPEAAAEAAKPADSQALVPAPPEDAAELTDNPATKLDSPKQTKAPSMPKAPKPPRQPGVGLAIFATIIIILGLAALATYAYLRTNNANLF